MSFDVKRMLKFEHNICEKEKKYRMIGGAVLILVSIPTAEITLLLLGLILVATGYSGWCPICSGFNRNTCVSGACETPTESESES